MDERLTDAERDQMDRWVIEAIGAEKAKIWWVTDNPLLGGMTPALYQLGWPRKCYKFIQDLTEDNAFVRDTDSADENHG